MPAVLTFDVEDWEHANFAQLKGQESRLRTLSRERFYNMDANVDRWIQTLGERQAKSTCFVLGEFAQRYPHSVRKLSEAGHEIASHGDSHDLVYEMTQEKFREWLKRGMGVLGELTGKAPLGFRAPSWSVDPVRTPWYCEELEAQGLKYDSSEFPVATPLFGNAAAPLDPYRTGRLFRLPVTVLTVAGFRLPFASGAFFRLSPLWLIRWGLRRAERAGRPVMVVLHPRELDPDHPRLPLRGWEASVHYAKLDTTLPKLRSILADFQWNSIASAYATQLDVTPARLHN